MNQSIQKITESEIYFQFQQQGDSNRQNNSQIDIANQTNQPQDYSLNLQRSQIELEKESRSNRVQMHINIQSFKQAPLTRDLNIQNIIEYCDSQDISHIKIHKNVKNQKQSKRRKYRKGEDVYEDKDSIIEIQKQKNLEKTQNFKNEHKNEINVFEKDYNQQTELSINELNQTKINLAILRFKFLAKIKENNSLLWNSITYYYLLKMNMF
ncbi:hypothetical protein ABPG72_017856 [Tetrahymena utriculariae]